jgi:hypothetical protein
MVPAVLSWIVCESPFDNWLSVRASAGVSIVLVVPELTELIELALEPVLRLYVALSAVIDILPVLSVPENPLFVGILFPLLTMV